MFGTLELIMLLYKSEENKDNDKENYANQ